MVQYIARGFLGLVFACSCLSVFVIISCFGTMFNYNDSLFYRLDAQILYFNTFITFPYMFRALLCSSSGGQLH